MQRLYDCQYDVKEFKTVVIFIHGERHSVQQKLMTLWLFVIVAGCMRSFMLA